VGLDQSEFGQQQATCVQLVGFDGAGESLPLLVPGALQQRLLDGMGAFVPVPGAVRQSQMTRNRRKPAATRPAHRRRISMHAPAAAIFPDAGVGLERITRGFLAERFEETEQRLVAGAWQAL